MTCDTSNSGIHTPTVFQVEANASGERQDDAPTLVGDLTGCGILFRAMHGSEQKLMARIRASFLRRGFSVRLATASTIGAAIACARFWTPPISWRRSDDRTLCEIHAVGNGREREELDRLPVEALRIDPAAVIALKSVAVVTIGQLARLRRSGVAERFMSPTGQESPVIDARSAVSKKAITGGRRRKPARAGKALRAGGETDMLWSPDFETTAGQTEEICPLETMSAQHEILSGKGSAVEGIIAITGITDVLHRMDQAFGLRPEHRSPIRSRNPIVLTRTFDGPTNRLEAIFLACGGLIDSLARTDS